MAEEFDLDTWLAQRGNRLHLEGIPSRGVLGRLRFVSDLLAAAQASGLPEVPRSVVWREGGEVRRVAVEDGTLLGRDPACAIVLQDPTVSRRHCTFHVRGGEVFVEDNKSANGTSVNDRPVTQARIGDGDVLQVGAVRVLFLAPVVLESRGAPPA